MKGQTRNIYPGGNTPMGFYSYYNYILPQMKAKKIFCIKGGPGTGKSTMMKNIAGHFLKKGEAVDFFRCSSDPDSLDGILLKNMAVAIIDGTAPHVTDPRNPGAVDEIVNMGTCWDERGIIKNREKIIRCNEKISEAFENAYEYLKCAWQQYEFISAVLGRLITEKDILETQRQLSLKMSSFSVLRRTENKVRKESVLGKEFSTGKRKKFFASAITPEGIKSELTSLTDDISQIIYLKVPVGCNIHKLTEIAADRLVCAGFDIEEYYCPMNPETEVEHVICPDARIAVITCNKYHSLDITDKKSKEIDLIQYTNKNADGGNRTLLRELQDSSEKLIIKALDYLRTAKEYHDILEEYYIPNMDFIEVEKKKNEIIGKIEGEYYNVSDASEQ